MLVLTRRVNEEIYFGTGDIEKGTDVIHGKIIVTQANGPVSLGFVDMPGYWVHRESVYTSIKNSKKSKE